MKDQWNSGPFEIREVSLLLVDGETRIVYCCFSLATTTLEGLINTDKTDVHSVFESLSIRSRDFSVTETGRFYIDVGFKSHIRKTHNHPRQDEGGGS